MKQEKIAKSYSQAIDELCNSSNISAYEEFEKITVAINSSNDLENILFLDVFTKEEKINVLKDVLKKLNSSEVVVQTLIFLIEQGRISLLPLIYKNIVVIDDYNKGFLRGEIQGSSDNASVEDIKKLQDYIEKNMKINAKLTYKKNSNISAGYRVLINDNLIDTSLESQLENFKNSITNS